MTDRDFMAYRTSFIQEATQRAKKEILPFKFSVSKIAADMLRDYFGASSCNVHINRLGADPTFDICLIHDDTLCLFLTENGFPSRESPGFSAHASSYYYYSLRNFALTAALKGKSYGAGDPLLESVCNTIHLLSSDSVVQDIKSIAFFVFTPDPLTETIPPGTFSVGTIRVSVRVFSLYELWEEGISVIGVSESGINDASCESSVAGEAKAPEGDQYARESRVLGEQEDAGDPDKGSNLTFQEYYDRFIERIESPKEKTPYRTTVSFMLKDFYSLHRIRLATDDGLVKVFDCWFVRNDVLCLCVFDRLYDERVEETITPAQASKIFQPLLDYVRKAASPAATPPFGWERGNSRIRVAGMIHELAHGKTPFGIQYLKLYAFTPSMPTMMASSSDFRMHELVFPVQGIECRARIINLKEFWAHGIAIPSSVQSSSELKETSEKPTVTQIQSCKTKALEKPVNHEAVSSKDDEADNTFSPEEKDFRLKLVEDSKVGNNFQRLNYFELCAGILCDADLYEEIHQVYINAKDTDAGPILLDGWAIDNQNNVLSLFVLDLPEEAESSVLSRDESMRLFSGLENFIKGSRRKWLYDTDAFEPSTEAGELADHAQEGLSRGIHAEGAFPHVHLTVISSRKAELESPIPVLFIDELRCVREIIDIPELFRLSVADRELRIDFSEPRFGGEPLCLIAAIDDRVSGYRSYVGKISANVLSEIYGEYGQRVLSNNVRAFLSTTPKVNRGIQDTIKNEPHKFFAYNNGICAVASGVETRDFQGVVRVSSASDFQIVNGGQTTASLYYARVQKKCSLENVFVPLKLSVVPRDTDLEEREEFVQNISKYANSQNKVTESDLGANTIFQVAFHKLYDNALCYGKTENGDPVGWFYERLRASYRTEINKKASKREQALFKRRYPKGCLFTKTDLGKWFMSWYGAPDITSRGAQKCFNVFVRSIQKPNEEKDPEMRFVTPEFFRAAVARGIMFKHLDNLIAQADWYKRNPGYKANLVAYTMALLTRAVKLNFGSSVGFDLQKIWDNQSSWFDVEHPLAYKQVPVFDEFASRLARQVREVFEVPNDIGEQVKKEQCWKDAQTISLDLGAVRGQFRSRFCCLKRNAWDFPKVPAQSDIRTSRTNQ